MGSRLCAARAAGSYFPKCRVVNSAQAGSSPYEGYGDPSAQAGGPFGDASAQAGCSDLEEDYEDMPVLHHSETEDVSSKDEGEGVVLSAFKWETIARDPTDVFGFPAEVRRGLEP